MATQQVSIIVLAYNRFQETTNRCLLSLSEDPCFLQWDLCVVDNGSRREEREALLKAQRRFPHMRPILLERNLGFPGGMNAGLRQTSGDPIFLIGSDIVVPPGTIGRLTTSLESYQQAGLVGPVTNSAGNEQRIFVSVAQPISAVLKEVREFVDAGEDNCVSAHRLDFCCVGIRRRVYDTIGGLDEAFTPGYYEDFDYSLRARNAGFDLLVAENAFVYHEGSASFGSDKDNQRVLIRRNKAILLKKHGRSIVLPHVRDSNLAVLAQYTERAERGTPPPAPRISNRLQLAHTDVPRSLLKRWRYLRRVAELESRLTRHLGSSRGA